MRHEYHAPIRFFANKPGLDTVSGLTASNSNQFLPYKNSIFKMEMGALKSLVLDPTRCEPVVISRTC